MRELLQEMKTAAISGGAVGGFAGLVTFIWTAVNHIQPALAGNSTMSQIGADFLTLGIAFGGGAELSALLGMALGILKALLLYLFIYFPIKMIQNRCQNPFRETQANTPSDSSIEPKNNPSPKSEGKDIEKSGSIEITVTKESLEQCTPEGKSQLNTHFNFFKNPTNTSELQEVVIENIELNDSLSQQVK